MKKILFSVLSVSLLIYGCVEPPDYPIEPVIEFISMDKTTLVAQTTPPTSGRMLDTLSITFSFTDGDGDLGISDTTQDFNVLVVDTRTGVADEPFRIEESDIPPNGVTQGISGEITVRIPETFCVPNSSPRDTLVYEIQIFDRAGNYSNKIQTPPIVLICD